MNRFRPVFGSKSPRFRLEFARIRGHKPKPMTIVLAIRWNNGIIVAADTQFTDTSTGVVEYGSKINVINFQVDHILIAEAGIPSITNRVVEIITENSKGVKIENAMTVTRIAEEAVRELRSQCAPEQWEHGRLYGGAQLLLAFLAKREPFIYTLDVYGGGVALKAQKHYAAAGAGQVLAEYLLKQSSRPDAWDVEAIATAIDVVKQVKDHQKGVCGGDTNVSQLSYVITMNGEPVSKSIPLNQEMINKTEKRIGEKEAKFMKARNEERTLILQKIGSEIWEKYHKKVEAEQKSRLDARYGQ